MIFDILYWNNYFFFFFVNLAGILGISWFSWFWRWIILLRNSVISVAELLIFHDFQRKTLWSKPFHFLYLLLKYTQSEILVFINSNNNACTALCFLIFYNIIFFPIVNYMDFDIFFPSNFSGFYFFINPWLFIGRNYYGVFFTIIIFLFKAFCLFFFCFTLFFIIILFFHFYW